MDMASPYVFRMIGVPSFVFEGSALHKNSKNSVMVRTVVGFYQAIQKSLSIWAL